MFDLLEQLEVFLFNPFTWAALILVVIWKYRNYHMTWRLTDETYLLAKGITEGLGLTNDKSCREYTSSELSIIHTGNVIADNILNDHVVDGKLVKFNALYPIKLPSRYYKLFGSVNNGYIRIYIKVLDGSGNVVSRALTTRYPATLNVRSFDY